MPWRVLEVGIPQIPRGIFDVDNLEDDSSY
ncbi:uncharacterized protein FFMR_06116 [Fusarium fujikuroi]|nr:uncharacterized protein FFMR_06116 [Fusarium fujikuroi]